MAVKKLILGLVLSLLSIPAFAAGSWTGTIKYIYAHTSQGYGPNGMVLVVMNTNGTGVAPCGSANSAEFVIDGSTNAGQTAVALLVRSLSLGLSVNAAGTGSCTTDSAVENLANTYISQ